MFLFFALAIASPADELPVPRLVAELVELRTPTGTLHGTLDLPTKPGPWPVVLIHAGSGPTNRDGNGPLVGTDNLKMVGRALAAHGIAVVRIDKRGMGASAKALTKEEDVSIDTYAADVTAWVTHLRKDARFTKVGYAGHSEGALIGLVAAKDAKFDAYVSLCGPGRPLQDVLREQLKKNLPENLYKVSDEVITELAAGRTVKEPPKELFALFRPSVQPFLISVFKHDPAKLIAAVPCPLLIVSGATDIQVSAEDATQLAKGNPKARLVTIERMNHVLKDVEGTHRLLQMKSYSDPTLPLHPKLMPELTGFFTQSLSGK